MKRLLVSLALVSAVFLPSPTDAAEPRSYVAGNFSLEVDGVQVGFIKSVSGLGYTRIVDGRTVARGVPTSVELRLGFSVRPGLDWIARSLAGTPVSALRLVARDYKLDAVERYDLTSFAFEQLQIPACDGSAKEPSHLRVRGRPDAVTRAAASGKLSEPYGKDEQSLWVPSNFRVSFVPEVDATKVNFVGPIEVNRGPHGFEIAPFDVSTSDRTAASWDTWAEKAIVRGETDERTMKLELLSPDRTRVLATFELGGVSPVQLRFVEEQAANADAVKRRVYKLAAKTIKLNVPKPPKGGKKPPKGK